MLFSSWENISYTALVGLLAYAGLVILLRISGKRTLTSMNIFDLVVTISMGSILATTILPDNNTLADGLMALAVLIGLQFLAAKAVVHSGTASRLIKGEPSLLLYQGELLAETMRKERITREEITTAVRRHGQSDISSVKAVVLETDGSLSVIIEPDKPIESSSLYGVANASNPKGRFKSPSH